MGAPEIQLTVTQHRMVSTFMGSSGPAQPSSSVRPPCPGGYEFQMALKLRIKNVNSLNPMLNLGE